jgi:hypothetical protein
VKHEEVRKRFSTPEEPRGPEKGRVVTGEVTIGGVDPIRIKVDISRMRAGFKKTNEAIGKLGKAIAKEIPALLRVPLESASIRGTGGMENPDGPC